MESSDKTKSTWGRFTGHGSTNTKAFVLSVLSIMLHSRILAKYLLRDAAIAGLSAFLQTTAIRV